VGVDDDSGWHDVLLGVWAQPVCDAVVDRIERSTIGRRGWLVRALADPERCAPEWTETVHALIVAAIRDETGADLDELGSQAAWECYEQVWDALTLRWADGGDLEVAAVGTEPEISRLIQALPVEAAAHAGADVTGAVPDPLWLGGRLHVDAAGLEGYLALDGGRAPAGVHSTISAILVRLRG
jgi:hypothetical protein